MAYEFFYQGTPYSLDSEYGEIFTGYRIPAGELGATTSIQTANQIKEVSNLLNQGIKNVEVSMTELQVLEMIPKQHTKEINRLSKLTGTETSLHAPVIDPSGFTQQGWNETFQKEAENQISSVVERGHELNPEGNIPVTIHASAVPGTESMEIKDKKTGKMIEVPQKMVAVNQETGEFIPLTREKRYYPRMEDKKVEKMYEPVEELNIANESYWDNKLSQLIFYKEKGDDILLKYYPIFKGEQQKEFTQEQKTAINNATHNAMIYLQNTHQTVNSLFNQAYKVADEKRREELKEAAGKFTDQYKNAYGKGIDGGGINPSFYSDALQNLINTMQEVTSSKRNRKTGEIISPAPQIYKPVEDFTKDKASETLGNVAFNSYKKFGDTSPIISIENPPYGTALSRGKDLKELVEKSREKFVKKLVKEKGMSTSAAKDAAEKLIGVTWDTSHISMMRKSGFKKDKLVKEAEIIAPLVKHVHYNDNFGHTHTDLPPGMGDVPLGKIMKKFEKAGFKGKKVFEGGAFFQHFQTSPHPYVLEATGSPLYGMTMPPYWNQIQSSHGNYSSGFGTMLPEQHFNLYGAGFSTLPTELGGQVAGKQSRFSGAPNA